jgi:CubicO group peptidase (beta-lactamase class C family)
MEIDFTVDAYFPRWIAPDDAPPQLREAWTAFEGQIVARWEEVQAQMVSSAREAQRRIVRVEEPCPGLRDAAVEVVETVFEEGQEAERQAAEAGELTRFQWPPPGYSHLLMEATGRARGSDPAGRRRESRPPPLPPHRPTEAPVSLPTGDGAGATVAAVLEQDIRPRGVTGTVAALQRGGDLQYFEAAGAADREGSQPLTRGSSAVVPALAEVLVSVAAASMATEGLVSLEAPISDYLPGSSPRLGAVTLRHLLTRRSGIDNAQPRDSLWSRIIDDLDDRAVFVEAGAVESYSRYDVPLVVRVLTAAAGEPLSVIVGRRVLTPLSMTTTVLENGPDGLPSVRTTAGDLLRLGAWWSSSGSEPVRLLLQPSTDAEGGRAAFGGGLWWDAPGGTDRVSLLCQSGPGADAVALQIYPERETTFALWSRPATSLRRWPEAAARFLLEVLGSDLGMRAGVFGDRGYRGAAELDGDPRPCVAPRMNEERVTVAGDPASAESWAGEYLNGDRIVQLEDREGTLWMTGDLELRVTHHEDEVYFATMDALPLYPLHLITDEAGRRYVVMDGRAHVHMDDRLRE